MADSRLYEEGNILCHLCDKRVDPPLSKCIDCDFLMCEVCTKSHSRVKLTSDHKIVLAGQQITLQHSLSKSPNIYCEVHSKEEVMFFCYTCKKCICSECITGNHSNHKCAVIKHAANELSDIMKGKLDIFKENKMDVLKLQIKKIKECLENNNLNSTTNQQNIRSRMASFMREIGDTRDILVQQSDTTTKQNEQYLSNIHKNLSKEFTDMKVLYEKYSQVLSSESNIENVDAWIHAVSDISQFKSHDEELEIKIDLPKFICHKTEISEIKLVFGSLETDEERGSDFDMEARNVPTQTETAKPKSTKYDAEGNEKTPMLESKDLDQSPKAENKNKIVMPIKTKDMPKSSIRVRVLSVFTVGVDMVTAMCPFTDSTVLTHCFGHRKNLIMDYNGRAHGSLVFDYNATEIIRIPNGLMAIDADNKNIIKYDMEGKPIQEIYITLVSPRRLCLSKDGSILVTMCDKWSYSVESGSRRYIAKMTTKGREHKIYEYNNGKRLFTLPFAIDENINKDICIVNGTTDQSGNLVVIDNDGRLKFVYKGVPGTKHFDPLRVKCDRMGHIIVTDNISSRIHLLDIGGRFIQYLSTKDGPIRRGLCCLSIDTSGYLWVGCTEGQVYVMKYLK